MKWKIGTIASHSALTILSGAKEEDFETVLFTKPERREFYQSFDIADEIIELEDYNNVFTKCDEETILIPHGSFIAYLGIDDLQSTSIPIFGTRALMISESNRQLKDDLLYNAELQPPPSYQNRKNVEFPVICKTQGADGGKGYFIANSPEELKEKIGNKHDIFVQKYIQGTKVYCTFFHSIIRNRLEVFGTDIRYETDADSQIRFDNQPSFQIVGNIPMVLRESLLFKYWKMGQKFCDTVDDLLKVPMSGPFCLETIIDKNMEIFTFEFSGRIVAGTNIFVPHSPYSYIQFGENMSMGRRIALEIREAIEQNRLYEVCV